MSCIAWHFYYICFEKEMELLKNIIAALEQFAPLIFQESYDNSGLQIGNTENKISSCLIALDCTEEILDEAINKKCQLIITHHPLIFNQITAITGKNAVERIILKAIKNNIALYAIHTNLDNQLYGVNNKIAEKLKLQKCKVLSPIKNTLYHLYIYVPVTNAEKLRNALFDVGAGSIGNYKSCSYNLEGYGTFLPTENTNPFIGKKNKLHFEKETKIEVVITEDKKEQILKAMYANHPYEEVAYGILKLENDNYDIGSGLIGNLEKPMPVSTFLKFVKEKMKTSCIRYNKLSNKQIHKVALCGGSGSFLLPKAIQQKADAFITADMKYHHFFDAENQLLLMDIGHYESEQYTGEIIYNKLSKKFPKFAIHLTKINTNPIKYY